MPKKALFFTKKVDKPCKMSYIINISKDAYKQHNTYYLRKGNTMKTFVYAAVAATIASSSMAATVGTPATVEWSGSVNNLSSICTFINQSNGNMAYLSSDKKWVSSGASVELKQRNVHMITVEPDHYVREVDSQFGNIVPNGVAHAVNVSYESGLPGMDSKAVAMVQDTTDPNNLGNTVELELPAGGVNVTNTVGTNTGPGVEINDAGQLDDSKKGKYTIRGTQTQTSTSSPIVDHAIPFGHLVIDIQGQAELVDDSDEALIKNDAWYAITHTVTCMN